MSRSKKIPKGKPLKEDGIAKVKPPKPWPNPPKPSVTPAPAGKGSKNPEKKD